MLLFATCIPQFNFSGIQASSPIQSDTNVNDLPMSPSDRTQIKLALQSIKNDGSRIVSIKEISVTEYEMMTTRIIERLSSNTEYDIIFEDILQILKEYHLIDPEITLQEIFDRNMSTDFNTTDFNVSSDPFGAIFSPVVIAGMGAGGGIGDNFGLLSGNVYSFGVIGLGGLFCLDVVMQTIHVQFTFTFPLLVHILAGFAGIMLFPVHFDKLYASGFPLFIYSNFLALGFSGFTIGFSTG
jgi:hypothetical protein